MTLCNFQYHLIINIYYWLYSIKDLQYVAHSVWMFYLYVCLGITCMSDALGGQLRM